MSRTENRREFVKDVAMGATALFVGPSMTEAALNGWDLVPSILARIRAPIFPRRDFDALALLKGDAGATYTMRMLGGTVDGETMAVTDAPKFKVGDHDLLFVEHNGSQFVPLVGIQHGRFRIQKDQAGNDTVVTGEGQPLADVSQLGINEGAVAKNKAPLSLRDFKAAVQTRLRQQQAGLQTP